MKYKFRKLRVKINRVFKEYRMILVDIAMIGMLLCMYYVFI